MDIDEHIEQYRAYLRFEEAVTYIQTPSEEGEFEAEGGEAVEAEAV
jgi:hypothetical protein